ncbi:hypothetical protein FNV43_RR01765 [Rhamnella rubrinervis]|uniref:Bifunctional inhibitor/plant lipid transfer protein/seed storage helical domain-containing protein n=1 Tax=Rhamnella rubrinervis TaxID=2594499 RepID=A0A8K0HSW7_9ROSA|nr:hypothetical protein FNV43_RR01765 [Rhamnella rubrinervis]
MALRAPYCALTGLLLALMLIHYPVMAQKPPATCADELVKFSPCLAYVSSPPNNLSDVVPSKCCDAFTSEFEAGEAICLCYLLQQPRIFGFPMDGARVLSLSSVCPLKNDSSLQSLCSGSQALPPLDNTTTSGISGTDNASAPENSSTPSSLPPIQLPSSATKNRLCRTFFGLVPIFAYTIVPFLTLYPFSLIPS